MEKTKVITVRYPIRGCYQQLPQVLEDLGWRMVRVDPNTHFLWWRKGDDWLLKRRRDLYISLYKQGANTTKIVTTIKEAHAGRERGDPMIADLKVIADHLQAHFSLLAIPAR